MRRVRTIRSSILLLFTALIPIFVGCGDSTTEPPAELVGTWEATALLVDGYDLMGDGMTLTYTFTSGGEYSYTVANDQLDFCNPGPNCSDSGEFTVSGNRITFDPDTVWEETYSYTLSGATLTVTATFGGSTFTFTFAKQ
jgi:hypothetical protein